jgi:hypothetical protein
MFAAINCCCHDGALQSLQQGIVNLGAGIYHPWRSLELDQL